MICSKCNEDKPVDEYYVKRGKPISYCKECYKSAERERYHSMSVDEKRQRQRPKTKEQRRRYARKRTRKYGDNEPSKRKRRARAYVMCAIYFGDLIRPTECSACSRPAGRIEAHHEDYDKPLEVVWLCRRCHGKAHRRSLT